MKRWGWNSTLGTVWDTHAMGTSLQNRIISWLGKSPFLFSVSVRITKNMWMGSQSRPHSSGAEAVPEVPWFVQMPQLALAVAAQPRALHGVPSRSTSLQPRKLVSKNEAGSFPLSPVAAFSSISPRSLTNCPLVLGISSLPYFTDCILSSKIVCSFVLYWHISHKL